MGSVLVAISGLLFFFCIVQIELLIVPVIKMYPNILVYYAQRVHFLCTREVENNSLLKTKNALKTIIPFYLPPFSLPIGAAVNSSTPRGIVTATTVPWSTNATTQPAVRPQTIQAALSTTAAVAAAAAAATTSSSSPLSSTTASLLSSILPTIDTNPLDVLAGTASAATSFLDCECCWPGNVRVSCIPFFFFASISE